MRKRTPNGQQGFILITVAVIGLVSTLVMAAALNNSVVVERTSVDQRLAEIRAYWAIMGHFRYGFSRIRQHHMCADSDGTCDSDDSQQDVEMRMVLQTYLDEIDAHRHVTYAEENANYYIDIATTSFRGAGATHNHSMHLGMRSSFPATQSTLPVLSGLTQRASPLELQFCVNLDQWTDPCGPLASNNFGGTLNGIYRVKRVLKL